MRLPLLAALAAGALAGCLTGCLPSSQRASSRALLPSDSASVALAAAVPADSLALVWSVAPPLALATGVAWAGAPGQPATLAVVETQEGALHRFSAAGDALGAQPLAAGRFPYLAGTDGAAVVALARGADRLVWSTGRTLAVPPGATAAFVRDTLVLVRTGGGDTGMPGAVLRLDPRTGREVARHRIAGAPWRAAGYLRPWADAVLALSGYRPVADVWTSGAGAVLDTLALAGFDSPLLGRSAAFGRGDADQPPLLAASAAALGDSLYVLNLRDDHVRVDVYARDGRLVRVLAGPRARPEVVPMDLAVRRAPGGAVEIAVVASRPAGLGQSSASRLSLFRWRPSPAGEDVRGR